MQELNVWFFNIKLSLSVSKSKFMLFGTQSHLTNFGNTQVQHRDQHLEQCSTYKFFVNMLDSCVNFQVHVDYMKSKTLGKVRLLYHVRHIIDRDTAMLLYKMLILPVYDYCGHIYYPLGPNIFDTLQKLQNSALHAIVRAEPWTSIDTLLIDAQMSHLNTCCKLHVAEQMFNFVNGNYPEACSELFESLNEHRIHTTRFVTEDLLIVPKRRLVLTECCIRYFGVVVWNFTPDNLRKAPTHEIFEHRVLQYWTVEQMSHL